MIIRKEKNNQMKKNQNTRRKRNLQKLRNIGSGRHQTSGDGKKVFKKTSGEQENYLIPNYIAEISLKDKYRGCPSRKILGKILKVDERRT